MDLNSYYTDILYPLQDSVLKKMTDLEIPFYLTGGTALHRIYYNYRYSDDLDFFVNGFDDFDQLKTTVLNGLKSYDITITNQSETFLSIMVNDKLKIDFVNDIPFYYGETIKKNLYYKVDNIMNILSNKLTCLLSRMSPKDLVDIWVIWRENKKINWQEIFTASKSKAAGIYPPQISQLISTFPETDLKQIKFIKKIYIKLFLEEKEFIIDDILKINKD